jgi:hypothetical protein
MEGLMGRQFFVSGFKGGDAYIDHANEVGRQGVEREGWDKTGSEAQVAGDKRRVRVKDAAIGLDTYDVHMSGDLAVVRAETPEIKGGRATGDVLQVVDRYDDAHNYLGSYEVRWEKTGERTHTLASRRRIFS